MQQTQQVGMVMDRDLYRRFKAGCILRGTTPTHLLNAYVQRQVEEWGLRQEPLTHDASCAYWEDAETPCTCGKRLAV
jgi:hypothetical protein